MKPAVDLFRAVAPGAHPNYTGAFEAGQALLERTGIWDTDHPARMVHFLAQVMHESGGGRVLRENLSYTTAARLLEIFGVGRHSAAIRPEEAPALLRAPERLAERVYGLGNSRKAAEIGNTQPGDGYRYRGGGLLQLTGANAYARASAAAGVDFRGDPGLIASPEHALKPAVAFWDERRLNAAADGTDIPAAVRAITRAINGGTNGMTERAALFRRIAAAAGVSEGLLRPLKGS